jgi:hypothetical protein
MAFLLQMEKAVSAVCSFVGLPRPSSSSRKFVLRSFPSADAMQHVGHYTQHAVEETYLHTLDNSHTRLRKRGDAVATTYKLRTKRLVQRGDSKTPHQHVEVSRLLNAREYISLKNKADQRRMSLHKTRRSFIWDSHYFELDKFNEIINPATGLPLVTLKVGAEEDLASSHLKMFLRRPPHLLLNIRHMSSPSTVTKHHVLDSVAKIPRTSPMLGTICAALLVVSLGGQPWPRPAESVALQYDQSHTCIIS